MLLTLRFRERLNYMKIEFDTFSIYFHAVVKNCLLAENLITAKCHGDFLSLTIKCYRIYLSNIIVLKHNIEKFYNLLVKGVSKRFKKVLI